MEAAKSLPPAKPLPPTFQKLIEELPGLINQEVPVAKRSDATEPGGDIVALGETSIEEIDKLMEELRVARDYLRTEGERVRSINARYAHLTRTTWIRSKSLPKAWANGASPRWKQPISEGSSRGDAARQRPHLAPNYDRKLTRRITLEDGSRRAL